MSDHVDLLEFPGSPARGSGGGRAPADVVFVAGPENRAVVEAVGAGFIVGGESFRRSCHADLSAKGFASYSPLVLYGPPGVGKTLLAEGIAEAWRSESQNSAVISINGQDFAREAAASTDVKQWAARRERMWAADLFVLDGADALAGRQAAQHELWSVLDAARDRRAQVVVTLRCAPQQLTKWLPGLAARLSEGLALPIALPGVAARKELLRRFAAQRGWPVLEDGVAALAEGLSGAPPELLGALSEWAVARRASRSENCSGKGDSPILISGPILLPGHRKIGTVPDSSRPLTAAVARKLLAERRAAVRPSLKEIVALTARYFGLKVADLRSASRRRAVVAARGVAIYLARQLTGMSLSQLGRHFGGRDHTTVMHSMQCTQERLRTDDLTRRAVAELTRMVAVGV